jgi:hypothetical protein
LIGYRIQQVSAEGDNSQNSDDWSTVASGKTAEEALKNFLKAINHDEVITFNNFYRLVLPDDKVAEL